MEESDKKNKKIKPEDKRVLLISIIMILALTTVSFWRLFNYKHPEVSFSMSLRDETHIPSLDEITSLEHLDKMMLEEEGVFPREEEKKYVRKALENKIIFDHPFSWRVIDLSDIENNSGEIEILFLSHSQTTLDGVTFTVLKIKAESNEEVIEIIKETSKGLQKIEMEILEEEEKNGETSLKILYKTERGQESFSKNKLFLIEEEYYFFSIIASREGIDRFSSQINHILSSIQIKE